MVKVRKQKMNEDVCDMSLLIEKNEEYLQWDDSDLVKSIMDEVNVAESIATEIAQKVKLRILEVSEKMGWDSVPTSLIREFVGNELISSGKKYQKKAIRYGSIGLSETEITNIIEGYGAGENSNIVSHNPEAVNFTIAEIILRKYALQSVFPSDVVKAHMSGRIHLHDSSQPHKFYCGSHSIQYIIKNGLKLPTVKTRSTSAKYAETLTNHICTYICSAAQIFAGALGLADVNNAYAPFLVGLNDDEIKQIAQSLIYSLAQTSFSRGGQVLFTDLNLNISTPTYLLNSKAIGPSGKYHKLVKSIHGDTLIECPKEESSSYLEYEKYSQKFLIKMMEVFADGDMNGLTFSFPKANVHFNEFTFDEKNREVLDSVFECAAKNGGIYFLFDRDGESSVSQCCRLKSKLTEKQIEQLHNNPEDTRFTALQNVSLSLPTAALESITELGASADLNKKVELSIKKIKEYMDLAMSAHKAKIKYIKHLYSKDGSPLSYARFGMDGEPYVRLNDLTYLIGIIGLDNMVYALCDKHLHESQDAYKLGMRIVAEIRTYCDELAKENKIKLSLEETPAESAAGRLASIAIKNEQYGALAKKIACAGDTNAPYWNNSVHYDYSANISFIDRIVGQSRFHKMIDAGAIIHLWVGENLPNKGSIEVLVKKVFEKTACAQFTISPEFTVCFDCNNIELGSHGKCFKCESENIGVLTRVVGYFSWTQNWSRSKLQEFAARNRKVEKGW